MAKKTTPTNVTEPVAPKEVQAKEQARVYTIPEFGVAVEATSVNEAVAKAKKVKDK